ncbi:MAG: hypothetical protein JKY62_01080 [Desulfocapsa sp.]|nr:hypothetical protein [Desulfocapsa sp.]
MVPKENGLQGQYFFLKRPAMGISLTYKYKNETRTNRGTTVKDTYHKFKERIGFKTDGWLYHPALMQYTLIIEPEWSQAKEKMEPGEEAGVDSFSPDYFVTATFLDPKPYTFDIFASRQDMPVWAAFAGNTESIVDSYGTTVRLKYETLPTTFGYSHIETDQTGFYTSQSSRDDLHLSSRHETGKSETSLSSTYSDDMRNTQGSTTQIKTFNNNLLNTYHITEDNRVNLSSTLTYRTQDTGNFDTQTLYLREHLNWWHRDNLQSNYSFSHNRLQSGESDSDKTAIEARLTHLFYENLTTNIGSSAYLYNYSGGKENAVDSFLDFTYRRPFSWGTLDLTASWGYEYTDRSGFTNPFVLVTDEAHTLSLTEETYLDNYNVDIDTIIVSNALGTIVYIENIDYSVDVINDFTRISRLPFGSIQNGQTVMINYRYLRDGEYDDTLFTETYGMSFNLWYDWYFSYNYLRANQSIISGQAPLKQIDDTIQRTQMRYNNGWFDTTLIYEDNNRLSDLAFTKWEIQQMLRYRPQWRLYLTLSGYFSQTDYTDREELKEVYGGVTTFDWMLNRWCKLRVEGYYNNTSGDIEETTNIGVKAGLEFRYRIWTARLTYELTDQDNIKTDYQRVEQLASFELIRIMW